MGSPTGTLTSFRGGLSELIVAAESRYRGSIRLHAPVETIVFHDGRYEVVCADEGRYTADEVFVCSPAYDAAPMLRDVNEPLSKELGKIPYAPIMVLGLIFPVEKLLKKPKGYGYLIPSSENKEVLGVLFESDIFSGRCAANEVLVRVMIGGARHPDILRKTKEEFVCLALEEIKRFMKEGSEAVEPKELFFAPWEKAIPQYDHAYCQAIRAVEHQLKQSPGLHLVANYRKGISLNDCVENAYQAAQGVGNP
jgi:oxygen-dependent protoporphyrinogen oxidase